MLDISLLFDPGRLITTVLNAILDDDNFAGDIEFWIELFGGCVVVFWLIAWVFAFVFQVTFILAFMNKINDYASLELFIHKKASKILGEDRVTNLIE